MFLLGHVVIFRHSYETSAPKCPVHQVCSSHFIYISKAVRVCMCVCIRLGRKGVNFGKSLIPSGVCYMGSKDEDVVKYFGKKNGFIYAQLDLKFMY